MNITARKLNYSVYSLKIQTYLQMSDLFLRTLTTVIMPFIVLSVVAKEGSHRYHHQTCEIKQANTANSVVWFFLFIYAIFMCMLGICMYICLKVE